MKIKEEQLKIIIEQQKKLTGILNNIGYLEAQKHGLLHQFGDINIKVEEFKSELENEYGAVNINLETGEYTVIEQEKKVEPELKVVEDVE